MWFYYQLVKDQREIAELLVEAKEKRDDFGIAYYAGQLRYVKELIKKIRKGYIE